MVIYPKEFVFCFFLFFLCYVVLASGIGSHNYLASTTDCNTTSCGSNGPEVRFPFRIKDRQPDHCGYPDVGFDLSCSEDNQTVLQLTPQWKFFINQIDYKSQVMSATHTEACFARQLLNFKLSLSPFQFLYYTYNYTLFNCSSRETFASRQPITCLSNLTYHVYASSSDNSILELELLRCMKMQDISPVPYDFLYQKGNILPPLSWEYPRCGPCEAKGKYCRLKGNNTTECYAMLQPNKGLLSKYIVTGGVLGSSVFLVAVILLYRLYINNKIDREYLAKIENFLDDYKHFKPTRYSYADIKRITNRFKEELGQGAYGTVFKGTLSDEILVAVKLLNNSKGNREEFINEVAAIGKIHHVHVVRLIGFCADGFIRALVYEYLPNDSLQKYISSADNSNKLFLGFKRLQDIALGIAEGVEYLHQGCDQRILHFDIKPQNILLDNDFSPKVSDFGLAKLCAKDQSAVSMTTARGTIGYIAPEVFSRNFGNVSYKSDVYSFGMLVLEMVGGKKNVEVTKESNEEQIYFPEWIYNLLQEGEDLRFQIEDEGDAKIAKKLAVVGLCCIQWNPADRPSMEAVVHMLEGEGENLVVPPNPFRSSGISRRTNKRTAGRLLHQELDVISEEIN